MEDKRIAAQKRAAEYNRKMIGQLYRHFKGDFYRVLFVAVHSETAELLVIYCKPEDTAKVWARPLAMFLSPVDTKKYPDAKQKISAHRQSTQSTKTALQQPLQAAGYWRDIDG